MKHTCITFAGVVGSSKTPITNYLSGKLGLPVLNNDAIRTEILEDFGGPNQDEYIARRNDRLQWLLERKSSFIYDASVDREWPAFHEWLVKHDYRWLIISLDFSKELLLKIYESKRYTQGYRLDELIADHQRFLSEHGNEITVHISDEQFADRLEVAYMAMREAITESISK